MNELDDKIRQLQEKGVDPAKIAAFEAKYRQPTSQVQTVTAQPSEMEWSEVGKKAVENLPSSTWDLLKGLGRAVTVDADDTLKGLYRVAKGASRDIMGPTWEANVDDQKAWSALKDFYSDRYGSMEGFKQALATDPASVLADAAGVLSLGGGAIAKAGTLSKIPSLAKAGAVVGGVGSAIDPINLTRQAVTLPARAVGATGLPQRMYMSAVKPPMRYSDAERAKMFQGAMKEKVVPTRGGLLTKAVGAKGFDEVGELLGHRGKQIGEIIQETERQGARGLLSPAAQDVGAEAQRVAKSYTTPREMLREMRNVQGQMRQYHPESLNPTRMQQLKRSSQKEAAKAYEASPLSETGSELAHKAVAKNFQTQLENIVDDTFKHLGDAAPDLRKLNASQQEVILLKDAIEAAGKRIEQSNIASALQSGTLTGGLTGAYYAESPIMKGVLAGIPVATIVASNPLVRSRLAIALARAKNIPNLGTRGAAARAALIGRQEAEEYGR